jgi:hypothetical protein
MGHVETPLTPPNQVVPEITEATSEALVRAMAKDPAERFGSYDEFIMALTAARSHLLVSQLRPHVEDEEQAGPPAAKKTTGLMRLFRR